ncbi:MAG: NlpC/P60 family protein [Alistipes sp.]
MAPVPQGDLIFFGNPASGRVTHVAMYLGEGRFIHSAGRVKINSLDPSADDYLPMSCLSISRIGTRIGTPGITAVRSHPWYFDIR